MLSAKSESFIENLQMYLFTLGKNEQEIRELIDELRVHLTAAENEGKSVEHIISGSPEQYMESLKAEMKTDYVSLLKIIPIFIIGTLAYFLMGPALRGEFAVNIIQLIGFPIVALFALLFYAVGLQRAGKKQYSSKKLFLFAVIAYITITLLIIALLLGSTLFVEPFYLASESENWWIVAACSLTFVMIALWSKTWFSIWIPAILFVPDLLFVFQT